MFKAKQNKNIEKNNNNKNKKYVTVAKKTLFGPQRKQN